MDAANFRELYKTELQEVCSLEAQLVQALPKMIEAAHDPNRVEEVLWRHGAEPREHTDQSMQAMISEAEKWTGMLRDPALRDAGLTASAQRVEHYEIAVYGTLATWAKQLGLEDDLHTLHAILEQEKHADDKLTSLAKSTINPHASAMAAQFRAVGSEDPARDRAEKGLLRTRFGLISE